MDKSEKRCTCCKQSKPLSEFHKRTLSRDGLAARCKPCRNEEMRERYQNTRSL